MMIKKIESKENDKIKLLKKLQQRKARHELGLFKVENLKTIMDAHAAGSDFEMIFMTTDFIRDHSQEFAYLSAKNEGAEFFELPSNVYKIFSELESPEGICAVYRIREMQIDYNKPIIYLNGINDPGNLGTILRSALAFDFRNVIVDEMCADVHNHKTIQAAKNSIFVLNIIPDKKQEMLKKMKKQKIELAAAARGTRAIKLNDWHPRGEPCVIFGSESHGINPAVAALSDKTIKITMSKNIESLNVSVSAAIMMHHVYQQK